MPSLFGQMLAKLTVLNRLSAQAGVCTCLVQRNRIKACEHSDIRQDRRVILSVAVTVRAYILHQRNVKTRAAMTDCLRILRHLTVEQFIGAAVRIIDRIKAACADTAAAALALIIIDHSLPIHKCKCVASALLRTAAASAAELFTYGRLPVGMLLHLTGAAAAAHSDVLDRTAESGRLMPFEMA